MFQSSIRHALETLCTKLPKNLKSQCDEFVQENTEKVIDMILADFTPQEVCTFLKLCHTEADVELVAPVSEKQEVLTNEIPRGEVDAVGDIKKKTPPMCYLCEFIMDKIGEKLKHNQTQVGICARHGHTSRNESKLWILQDVKRVVLNVCNYIPENIRSDCEDFVDKYQNYIISMIKDGVDPKMICSEMHMCLNQPTGINHILRAVEECALCEALVGAVRGLLEDKEIDRNIASYGSMICNVIPILRPDQINKVVSDICGWREGSISGNLLKLSNISVHDNGCFLWSEHNQLVA